MFTTDNCNKDNYCDCPTGWTKGVDNECLLIHNKTNTKTNYTTALKTCGQKWNAKLISIKSLAKHNFITQWFNDLKYDGSFWLDATRVLKADSSDSFYWSNGDRLTYTNWEPGLREPTGTWDPVSGFEICVAVQAPSSLTSLQWSDVPYWTKHRTDHCNKDKYCGNNCNIIINGGSVTINNGNDCPTGWTKGVDNECLLIYNKTYTKSNYTTALKTCAQKYNAKIISIKSAAKQNFIAQWFKDQKFDALFWLDATRVLKADSPDSFIWSNGDQMTYTNWDTGNDEPNGNKNSEDVEIV
ncbi:unnamed protein product [Oppiella nova]|uniref:C-type lectin domain-containing protein n=1 Tax=Oppiella nova TaxID=334625 RepID=A0A7R9QAC2_9ACAR|nr:unnamed protein product [Oppiella nova]CAG2161772.1 unnamed protein product [Oppiella nova]